MAMVPINWHPDRKSLAEFSEAWMFSLGMVLAPWQLYRGQATWSAALWALAVAGRLVGLVRPGLLRPVYIGLMLATWPIGWAISHLALALVYFVVLTPIGLALRLIGRNPLNLRFDREAATYWEPYAPDRGLDRYLKQF